MESQNQLTARIGARRVSDDQNIRDGFSKLCIDTANCYDSLLKAISLEQTIDVFNDLAPLCLSVFEIGSAGRGERPDRINAASALVSEVMFVKDDKLTDGEKSTRLLPHTNLTTAALKIYTSAMEIACRRLNLDAIGATDSLFCRLEAKNESSADGLKFSNITSAYWKALEAADVTKIAKTYFKSDPNFQRHEFITALDEAEANRWVIRVLSGHGSHLTNAFAHTQGVAPLEGITELAVELEKSYPRILGSAERLLKCAETLKFNTPALPLDIKPSSKAGSETSHSPADLLPLTDRQCIIDWRLIQCARSALAVGDLSTSTAVPTLASLLAHSGVPTLEIAIDFLCGSRTMFVVGNMPGLVWKRRHYLHDVWLPIQKPTHLLINQIPADATIDRDGVIADSARWIKSIPGFTGWPKSDWEVLTRFCNACERWRRIALPPFMCLLASPYFDTACLSPASLQRLAMPKSFIPGEIGSLARVFIRQSENPTRNHNVEKITTILNSARDGTALGGQIARAQLILKELNSLKVEPTSVFNFSKDVIQRECSSIIEGRTEGKVSTLATRWSALQPTLNAYPLEFTFEDLAEDDFIDFADKVNDHCLSKMQKDPLTEDSKYHIGNGKERSKRARDALQWLFHNLQQDGWDISAAVWTNIGGATVRYPRISASSTLVLPSALSQMAKAAKAIFSEQPRLGTSFITKLTVMSKFPMRIGEASTVAMKCVTDSGEIAVGITPFATDKSGHAPRTWPISQDLIDLLKALQEQQLEINPHGKWLYRFDDRATAEDAIVNQQLGVLLRWATGDEAARPHALRGFAYQEILWPGWTEFATLFLTTGKTSFDCDAWVHRQPSPIRWTLPTQSMQAAGHGAVDPGLQAYAAAWPLMYGIYLSATLIDSQPSDFWRSLLKINQNTFNVAKSRKPESQYDRWHQIARGVRFHAQPPLFTPPRNSSDDRGGNGTEGEKRKRQTISAQSSITFNKAAALRFLALVGMGESEVRSQRVSNLPNLHCSMITKYLPSNTQINLARKRLKSTILGRALVGDIEFVKEDSDIANWVAGLQPFAANDLRAVFFRDGPSLRDGTGQVRDPDFWMKLTKNMPSGVYIAARFGRGDHLKLSEEQQLKEIGPSFVLGDRHRDIGAMPQVMLPARVDTDDVDSRRRTAVLKLYLLMLKSIEDYQRDNPEIFSTLSSKNS